MEWWFQRPMHLQHVLTELYPININKLLFAKMSQVAMRLPSAPPLLPERLAFCFSALGAAGDLPGSCHSGTGDAKGLGGIGGLRWRIGAAAVDGRVPGLDAGASGHRSVRWAFGGAPKDGIL